MSQFTITGSISEADLATILDGIKKTPDLISFLKVLSASEKKSALKVGAKLLGFITEIDNAANTFPNAIPAGNPIAEFESRIQLNTSLTKIEDFLASVLQSVSDTRLVLCSELLATANIYYSSFQKAAKTDLAMAETLDKISKVYSKKSHAMPVIQNITAGGVLQVKNVVTGTQLINKGTTVISFKAGNELVSKVREPAIVVDPNTSAKIPAGWTSIEITNLSTSVEATVAVRLK